MPTINMKLSKQQLADYAKDHPVSRKVVIPLFNHASKTLSAAAAHEQAASGTPAIDVPGEILHLGDGSAKSDTSIDDAAVRANAGLSGMSTGEKVGIVAAAGLAVAGIYHWLGKKR